MMEDKNIMKSENGEIYDLPSGAKITPNDVSVGIKGARRKTITQDEMEELLAELKKEMFKEIKEDMVKSFENMQYRLYRSEKKLREEDMIVLTDRFCDLETKLDEIRK